MSRSQKINGLRNLLGILTITAAVLSVAFVVLPRTSAASATESFEYSSRNVVAKRAALSPTLQRLEVQLPDIPPGATFRPSEVLFGFGCAGGNQSPAISWTAAPAGTQSFLITMFDVDAPTSSGFWHWAVWNIPGTTASLPAGAGTAGNPGLPAPSVNGRTDFGVAGYGGPCPPAGEKPHRYTFVVVALDIPALPIPNDLPIAAVNVVMRSHALAFGTRVVEFGR